MLFFPFQRFVLNNLFCSYTSVLLVPGIVHNYHFLPMQFVHIEQLEYIIFQQTNRIESYLFYQLMYKAMLYKTKAPYLQQPGYQTKSLYRKDQLDTQYPPRDPDHPFNLRKWVAMVFFGVYGKQFFLGLKCFQNICSAHVRDRNCFQSNFLTENCFPKNKHSPPPPHTHFPSS